MVKGQPQPNQKGRAAEGRASGLPVKSSRRLSTKIIEADILVLNTQGVEQVKHRLGHHRRTAEVVLDVLGGVMLLEVGVAHVLCACRLCSGCWLLSAALLRHRPALPLPLPQRAVINRIG